METRTRVAQLREGIEYVMEIIMDSEEELKDWHKATIKQITPEIRSQPEKKSLNDRLTILEGMIRNAELYA